MNTAASAPSSLADDLSRFGRDPLAYVTHLRGQGPAVRFRLGATVNLGLFDPGLVCGMMRAHEAFPKGHYAGPDGVGRFLGDGPLSAVGPKWRASRAVSQSAFTPSKVTAAAARVLPVVDAVVDRWRAAADAGTPVDLPRDIRRLTLLVVLAEFFDDADRDDFDAFEAVINIIDAGTDFRGLYAAQALSPEVRRKTFAAIDARDGVLARLEAYLAEFVDRPAASGEGFVARAKSDPMLARIDSGNERQALRDIASTFIFAGFGTTASALFSAILTCMRHPDVLARIREELAPIDAAAVARGETRARAPYLVATIHEVLRLYPPIWWVDREATGPGEIGGVTYEAGDHFVLTSLALHRDPAHWDDPDAFRPERFLDGLPTGRARAYIPFGFGPRYCAGAGFAVQELLTALARILPALDFDLPAGRNFDRFTTAGTLRPAGDWTVGVRRHEEAR
ncbi:MAG: cytochrome P450 [Vicinamibacterales bacterium]